MKRERIVITGGGSGLGRALALEYAEAGWRVAVLDRNRDAAERVATEVEAAGGKSLALACDVTDHDMVAHAATAIARGWHGLDVLVNNAGIAGAGIVLDTPEEDWRRIMEVNFFALVEMTRAALPALKQGNRPIVVGGNRQIEIVVSGNTDPANVRVSCDGQDQLAHLHDGAGLLGDLDELAGGHQAAFRMVPAQQGLAGDDPYGAQVDDRLEMCVELIATEQRELSAWRLCRSECSQ